MAMSTQKCYWAEVTEDDTAPDCWHGLVFTLESPRKPTRTYRLYLSDIATMSEEDKAEVAVTVKAMIEKLVREHNPQFARHLNG
jgi:hypothetical protein